MYYTKESKMNNFSKAVKPRPKKTAKKSVAKFIKKSVESRDYYSYFQSKSNSIDSARGGGKIQVFKDSFNVNQTMGKGSFKHELGNGVDQGKQTDLYGIGTYTARAQIDRTKQKIKKFMEIVDR